MKKYLLTGLLSLALASNAPASLEKRVEDLITTNIIYTRSAKPTGPVTYEDIRDTIGVNNPFLVIDKSEYKLYLISYNCINHPCEFDYLNKYNISVGRNKGDKKKAGDRKTPEGIYKIIRIENKFGGPAFRINYPNKEDKYQKKTGNGILIHITSKNKIGKRASQGCIGLVKKDIYNLKGYATLGTKVIIMP